jgi:hypothetical protein
MFQHHFQCKQMHTILSKIPYIKPLLKPCNSYNKPCFECAYLSESVIDLLKQKITQNVANTLGYFIFSKNHNEPPKVAQLAKKLPNLVALTCLQAANARWKGCHKYSYQLRPNSNLGVCTTYI